MFGLRQVAHWTFPQFTVVLVENIAIYMLAALVLPDFTEDRDADLRRTYFHQARWFYGLLVVAFIFSILKDFVVFGAPPHGANLAFHLFFIAGGIALPLIKGERFHKIYAVFSLLLLYIGALFEQLH